MDGTNREYFKIKVKYSSLNGSHSHRLLIDKWYIARYDEETLLSEITKMAEEKELLRKPGVSNSNSK